MKPNPLEESQRLASLYCEMGEIELRELAVGIDDLTDVAKQVLRDELKKRGLDSRKSPSQSQTSGYVERKNFDLLAGPMANSYLVPSGTDDSEQEDDVPVDYTWKTLLCECNEAKEALQLAAALERAGIESWAEGQRSYSIGVGNPRVWVPADRLEEARAVATKPIPQDIIDELNEPPEEFVPPTCPACGAKDPTLESTDPSNTWVCESCDNTWTEPLPK